MRNNFHLRGLVAVLLFLFSVTFWSCQKQGEQPASDVGQYKPNFTLAKTSGELIALRRDPKTNIIRSLADYDALVSCSPLAKLPATVRGEFRKNLMILEGAVASMKFGVIQRALSEDDFAQVMAMFGMDVKRGYWGLSKDPDIIRKLQGQTSQESTLSDEVQQPNCNDYIGYFCASANTCYALTRDYICMSGCNTRCH